MAERGGGGRFMPGAGGTRGPTGDGAVSVVPRLAVLEAAGGFTFELAAEPVALDLDARGLADIMRTATLLWHRNAILSGTRPDGSGRQPGLGPRARKAQRLTPYRGARTGEMADRLRAGGLQGSATSASSLIAVPTNRNVFAAAEAARGIRYLSGSGKAAEVVRLAAREWLVGVVAGRSTEFARGAREAQDVARG